MVQGRSDGEEDMEWVSLTFLGHICTQVYVQVPAYIHGEARGEQRILLYHSTLLLEWKSVAESAARRVARKL